MGPTALGPACCCTKAMLFDPWNATSFMSCQQNPVARQALALSYHATPCAALHADENNPHINGRLDWDHARARTCVPSRPLWKEVVVVPGKALQARFDPPCLQPHISPATLAACHYRHSTPTLSSTASAVCSYRTLASG